jgi:hypothetical protein
MNPNIPTQTKTRVFLNPLPFNNQKSFNGKAQVEVRENHDVILYSYGTRVLIHKAKGAWVRVYDSWSATTGRHISAFVGVPVSKKKFIEMEVYKEYPEDYFE